MSTSKAKDHAQTDEPTTGEVGRGVVEQDTLRLR